MTSPFEEIKELAKSTLASQVKDALNSDSLAEQQVLAVRGLVERFITPKPTRSALGEIQALAKSVLAYQIREVLDDEGMTPEGKVRHIRGMIHQFIVNPDAR